MLRSVVRGVVLGTVVFLLTAPDFEYPGDSLPSGHWPPAFTDQELCRFCRFGLFNEVGRDRIVECGYCDDGTQVEV